MSTAVNNIGFEILILNQQDNGLVNSNRIIFTIIQSGRGIIKSCKKHWKIFTAYFLP